MAIAVCTYTNTFPLSLFTLVLLVHDSCEACSSVEILTFFLFRLLLTLGIICSVFIVAFFCGDFVVPVHVAVASSDVAPLSRSVESKASRGTTLGQSPRGAESALQIFIRLIQTPQGSRVHDQ